MAKIEPRIFKGTRDFLPDEMMHREEIQNVMRTVFQKYGFEPIETPAIEYLNVLTGKYGEDADRLIYRLNYKTGTKDEAALHYDLTVPFSRVIAMNKELPKPFKRYQIQPVWRADSPQPNQGRFREFYQCDIDAVGSKSMMVDAEIICIVNEILTLLGFKGFLIKVNNRKILNGLVAYIGLDTSWTGEICRNIDKLDKISFDEVAKELTEKNVPSAVIDKLKTVVSEGKISLDDAEALLKGIPVGEEGVNEMKELFSYLNSMNIPKENFIFEISLARGLDYYTGPIFETTLPQHPHIGSLTGGGRYDELIGHFSGIDTPAVGTSLGLDRILSAMKQLGMLDKAQTRTKVLVTAFSKETMLDSLRVASMLRESGINTEIFHEPVKLKSQFSYADKKGIRYVAILGEDEIKNGTITIKDMQTREQKEMANDEIIKWLNC
ncbi:MAG: histidine--tRNA ligase [Marinilabiliaceae bacterium]|nr:histidine--tRNA ligase [Marinilabiliaceae bacterium]